MRCIGTRSLAFLAIAAAQALAWAPAWAAMRVPDPSTVVQTEHQMALRNAESRPRPYAMNYTDEMAQSLGVRDGKWEVFDTRSSNPLMPSLKGGIDSGGAMIGLQWRQ